MRLGLLLLAPALVLAQTPKRLHPTVEKIAAGVSADRIAATLQKLEAFGTRDIHSAQIHEATRWIESEFKAMSPRLEVSLDKHLAKKRGRMMRDSRSPTSLPCCAAKRSPTSRCSSPPITTQSFWSASRQ